MKGACSCPKATVTYEERCQIEALQKRGLSQGAIARQLGRSTIFREIKRNTGGRGYRHKQAQRMAETRRRAASSVSWRLTPRVEAQKKLREGPEQRPFSTGGPWVGNGSMIAEDRRAGGVLWKKLRRRGKKPNWKGGCHSGRVDISERPAEAKERVGDREPSSAKLTVELSCRSCHEIRLAGWTERHGWYDPPARLWCAIGPHNHNGKEFADHRRVAEAFDADFFFAFPFLRARLE